MFSFLVKKKPLLGLDIGASSVKAVQLSRAGRAYELTHLGMAPLSPEAIVDGVIMDGSSVISAIQQIYQEHGIKTRDVAVAVSGNSVIVKKIKVQQMTEEELTASIQWEAEQYIPFPIEDVHLDFQILEPRGGAEMDILLVAVKKDVMNDYLTVISSAGLNGRLSPQIDRHLLHSKLPHPCCSSRKLRQELSSAPECLSEHSLEAQIDRIDRY
jgi:type IV pilus assembly protein PilM